jgi:hypothetical protein
VNVVAARAYEKNLESLTASAEPACGSPNPHITGVVAEKSRWVVIETKSARSSEAIAERYAFGESTVQLAQEVGKATFRRALTGLSRQAQACEGQMSQRDSGYERKDRDLYETPAWVTKELLSHLRACETVWEPAAGSGKMVGVLESFAENVIATDIETGHVFREAERPADAIITNPPQLRWRPSSSNVRFP